MQNDFSKLTRESYTSGKITEADALKAVDSALEDALILHPDIPANRLPAMADIDPEAARAVGDMLLRRFLARRALAIRRKLRPRQSNQPLLPGFEALPAKIPAASGGTVKLLAANYTDAREFYWGLIRSWNDRKNSDPLVTQAKALMEKMQGYASEERITVEQVFRLEGTL